MLCAPDGTFLRKARGLLSVLHAAPYLKHMNQLVAMIGYGAPVPCCNLNSTIMGVSSLTPAAVPHLSKRPLPNPFHLGLMVTQIKRSAPH